MVSDVLHVQNLYCNFSRIKLVISILHACVKIMQRGIRMFTVPSLFPDLGGHMPFVLASLSKVMQKKVSYVRQRCLSLTQVFLVLPRPILPLIRYIYPDSYRSSVHLRVSTHLEHPSWCLAQICKILSPPFEHVESHGKVNRNGHSAHEDHPEDKRFGVPIMTIPGVKAI